MELESQLKQEVQELLSLGEQADHGELELSNKLVVEDEIALRQERLANLAQAKAVLEAHAHERCVAEKAEYEAKMRERQKKARKRHHKPEGPPPQPPEPGPRDKDQYNFINPDWRITPAPNHRCGVKNSTNDGFDQHYNLQLAADQESRLIVAQPLSNHADDKQEALPTLGALAPELGQPDAVALDNGYFSEANIQACEKLGIEPYIATDREPDHLDWHSFFQQQPEPPSPEASAILKMAYRLQTKIGQASYRFRKSTVEPLIGIIKEILDFRQFSLRGPAAAAGEWALVCLASNLRRMHILYKKRGLLQRAGRKRIMEIQKISTTYAGLFHRIRWLMPSDKAITLPCQTINLANLLVSPTSCWIVDMFSA